MGSGPVIMIIGTECSPEWEQEWNKFYDEKHIPDILQFEGVKSAARYKIRESEGSAAKYIAIYEFENWEAVEAYRRSKLRQEVREDWDENWEPKGARIVSRAFYEPMKTWTK